MDSAIGTISTTIGIGSNRLIAAAMAPMSAPALTVLATNRPKTAAHSSERG